MRQLLLPLLLLFPALVAIELADVPLFGIQCRLTMVDTVAPRAKDCFEFCVTLQPDCTHSVAQHACGGNWTDEVVFSASSVNATAREYPNDEGGLVTRFPALATKLGIVPPGNNWHPQCWRPNCTVALECTLRFRPSATHPSDGAQLPVTVKYVLPHDGGTFVAGLLLWRNGTRPAAQTYADWNAERYWRLTHELPPLPPPLAMHSSPVKFPVVDTFMGDDDYTARGQARDALQRGLGINMALGTAFGPGSEKHAWGFSTPRTAGGWSVLGKEGEYRKASPAGGTTSCRAVTVPPSACTLHDYNVVNSTDAELVNGTDIAAFARLRWAPYLAAGYNGSTLSGPSSGPDEPSWSWPAAMPPVRSSSIVRARWIKYLQSRPGLSNESGGAVQPSAFGHKAWDDVMPLGRADAGAGATQQTINCSNQHSTVSALEARRLHYWSMRFSHWDAARYLNQVIAANIILVGGEATFAGHLYSNMNNMMNAMYVAGNPLAPSTDPNFAMMALDCFEFARLQPSENMLWTEDWFPDNLANRWSFFSARLRTATVLANHGHQSTGSSEFSGYIVPRAGGQEAGGILKRGIAIIGSGAKALRYFMFGPEYSYPNNCYGGESNDLKGIFTEMRLAHAIIAKAEPVLWRARRGWSEVAILMPRSSGFWDFWDEAHPHAGCICCCENGVTMKTFMEYSAETYGLYLAMATDLNVPVDLIDEDALEDPSVLSHYKAIFISEPNVPAAGMAAVLSWTRHGGHLVTVSNAGVADAYNTPDKHLRQLSGIGEPARARFVLNSDRSLPVSANGVLSLPAFLSQPAKTTIIAVTAYGVHANLTMMKPKINIPDTTTTAEAAEPQVLGRWADGGVALAQTAIGVGMAIRFGWLPGVSYWFSGRAALAREPLAAILSAAGVEPPVTVNTSSIETPLLLHPSGQGAVVSILDFRCAKEFDVQCADRDKRVSPLPLSMEVRLAFEPKAVTSMQQGALTFHVAKRQKMTTVKVMGLVVSHADMVVLE